MNTPPQSWLEETAKLLRNRFSHIRLKTISDACDVSEAWLSKLQTGKLNDPSIVKVERVFQWLKDNSNA